MNQSESPRLLRSDYTGVSRIAQPLRLEQLPTSNLTPARITK